MKKIILSGTITLFLANLVSKIIGAFYRLPLSNIIGAEGMGLYQMVFPVYSFLLTLITGGTSVFLTRQIAHHRAKDDYFDINKDYILAQRTSLFFGIIFSLIMVIFAYPISVLQGTQIAFSGYIAISIGFVFASMLGVFRGYYQGFGTMGKTATSGIIEQSAKLVFGLIFAYIFSKNGITSGVFGALLGISVSEILSFMYFLFAIKKDRIQDFKISLKLCDYIQFIKKVAPVCITYVLLPLSSLIDSFLIVNILQSSGYTLQNATALYGIQAGMILPLINMPNMLISAIALANIPLLSYSNSKNESCDEHINKMFKSAFLFILPCAVGMFIVAEQIIRVVFPTLTIMQLQTATLLLKISSFEMFFLSFVSISNSILQAISKTNYAVYSLSLGVIIKTILTIFFVSNIQINIYGLAIANSISYFIVSIINIIKIKKETAFRLNFWQVISPIFASSIMTFVVILTNIVFANFSQFSLLVVNVISAILIYFSILFILKQFNIKDLKKMLQIK